MSSIVILVMFALFALPGARLALLWRRSRLAPEGWLALFFLGFAIGVPIRFYVLRHPELAPGPMEVSSGIALFVLLFGASSMLLFNRTVFRPTSSRARLFCRTILSVFLVSMGIVTWQRELTNLMHPALLVANFCAIPVFWWAFFECAGQYAAMRRQARLGIGDSLVRNRFLLWSFWTGALCMLPSLALGVKLWLMAVTPAGQPHVAPESLLLFMRVTVLAASSVAAVSIWLSFFPPRGYAAWLRRVASRMRSTEPDEAQELRS